MVRTFVLIAAAAVVIAACRNPMIPEGASQDYADGWDHGCASGYDDMGRATYRFAGRKEVSRYRDNADYAAGWDAGYEHCAEEEYRTPWLGPPAAMALGGTKTPG